MSLHVSFRAWSILIYGFLVVIFIRQIQKSIRHWNKWISLTHQFLILIYYVYKLLSESLLNRKNVCATRANSIQIPVSNLTVYAYLYGAKFWFSPSYSHVNFIRKGAQYTTNYPIVTENNFNRRVSLPFITQSRFAIAKPKNPYFRYKIFEVSAIYIDSSI